MAATWEVRIDMKESSALTEASGLTEDLGDLERASVNRSNAKTRFADGRATPPTSQDAAVLGRTTARSHRESPAAVAPYRVSARHFCSSPLETAHEDAIAGPGPAARAGLPRYR